MWYIYTHINIFMIIYVGMCTHMYVDNVFHNRNDLKYMYG